MPTRRAILSAGRSVSDRKRWVNSIQACNAISVAPCRFFWGRPIVTDACRYCGSLAQYGDSRIDVPCCRECYSLLLDRAWLGTFAERRDFVRCVLANRYARILHAPRWTAAEIDELEGNLKKQVIELQQLRDVIENRLDWQGESVQDEAR